MKFLIVAITLLIVWRLYPELRRLLRGRSSRQQEEETPALPDGEGDSGRPPEDSGGQDKRP